MLWQTNQLFLATRILVRPRTTLTRGCRRHRGSPTSWTSNRRLRWNPMTCKRCRRHATWTIAACGVGNRILLRATRGMTLRGRTFQTRSSGARCDLPSPPRRATTGRWRRRRITILWVLLQGRRSTILWVSVLQGRRMTILWVSLLHARAFGHSDPACNCYQALLPTCATGRLGHRCAAGAARQADQDCEAYRRHLVLIFRGQIYVVNIT